MSRTRRRPCPTPDQVRLRHNLPLSKRLQALLDTNRFEPKAFREHARMEKRGSGLCP